MSSCTRRGTPHSDLPDVDTGSPGPRPRPPSSVAVREKNIGGFSAQFERGRDDPVRGGPATVRPTSVEPVKEIFRMLRVSGRNRPSFDPRPVTVDNPRRQDLLLSFASSRND